MSIDFSHSFISKQRQLDLAKKVLPSNDQKKVWSYFPAKGFEKLHLTELFLIIEHFVNSNNDHQQVVFCSPVFDLAEISHQEDFVLNFSMCPIKTNKESLNLSTVNNELWLKKHELQNKSQEKNCLNLDLYGFSPFLLANASNMKSVETDLCLEKLSSLVSILTEMKPSEQT